MLHAANTRAANMRPTIRQGLRRAGARAPELGGLDGDGDIDMGERRPTRGDQWMNGPRALRADRTLRRYSLGAGSI